MDDATTKQWWWFDPAHAAEKCEAALAWETLRRTKFYPALWRKCIRVRSEFLGNQSQPKRAEAFRLIHLYQRCKSATSEQVFRLVLGGFDPDLTWLGLTERQRLSARGYAVADTEAIKVAPAYTLPRQTLRPSFAMEVTLCEIDRNSAGQMILSKGKEAPLAEVTRFPFFQTLSLATPGRYLCVYFDTRLGRETLLAALCEQRQFWTPGPQCGSSRLKDDEVHVIPSDMPPFAIFLAPAKSDAARLQAAFHTQLKAAQRGDWFLRCVEHWKTVKVEFPMVVPKADGTIEIDCRGFPVLTKVTRYLFDPKQHLPPEQKQGKSAGRAGLWLGLAASDVVRQGKSLFKRRPEIDFLITHCQAWRTYSERATKSGKQDFPEQRQARKKSCHELRNHHTSAKVRLEELDEMFGRLDKNLEHWIKENTKLAQSGFFSVVANGAAPLKPAAVTSKPSDSETPPKSL